jgi:hypothetical protein
LKDADLWPLLRQLSGMTRSKPFDCIGTVDEVNAALQMTMNTIPETGLPDLLKLYKDSEMYSRYRNFNANTLLHAFNENNFLPKKFETLLRSKIYA